MQDVESLIKDWEKLRKDGNGYFEVFQVESCFLGKWTSLFEKKFDITRKIKTPDGHICQFQSSPLFQIEEDIVSNFGLDHIALLGSNSSNKNFYGEIFIQYTKLKNGNGKIIEYAHRSFYDDTKRLDVQCLAIEGPDITIYKTFNLLYENISYIKKLISTVFEWENKKIDILEKATKVHYLDIQKSYPCYKRFIINRRHNNPDVKTIDLTY